MGSAVTGGPSAVRPESSASNLPVAMRPAWSASPEIVVRGGVQKDAPKMSSQPMTLISSGTVMPRCPRRCKMPMASRSLKATHAVASFTSRAW